MPPLLLLGLVAMLLVARNAQQVPKAAKGTTARGILPGVALAINPTASVTPSVGIGDFARLIFLGDGARDALWVRVTTEGSGNGPHGGVLSSDPKSEALRGRLRFGQPIAFYSDNVEVLVRSWDYMTGAKYGLIMQ